MQKHGQVEEPNLVFMSFFFLLTYPECFKDADCSYGTCTGGLCKCKDEQIKEGRICKRGENMILQKIQR